MIRAAGGTSVLLLACVLVVGGCSSTPRDASRDTAAPATGPGAASATTGSPATRSPATSAPRSTPDEPDPSSNQRRGRPEAASTASPGAASAEVGSGTVEPSGAIGLPRLAAVPTGPLVSRPLPRPASARGRLVSGFPSRVAAPLPGSDVSASGVTSQGPRLQATVTATTTRSVDRVLLGYRLRLARLGFVEAPSPVGSTEIAFTRGRSRATVTATAEGRTTSYAVLVTLHAG